VPHVVKPGAGQPGRGTDAARAPAEIVGFHRGADPGGEDEPVLAARAGRNAALVTAPAYLTGPSSFRQASCRHAKITVKVVRPRYAAGAPPWH
jgi:hypothetical protein